MNTYLIIISIVTVIYIILILSFLIGWIKIKNYKKGQLDPSVVFASVVIAAKNEAKNILQLLDSLNNQTLDTNNFEIILINDNSTDTTLEIALSCMNSTSNLHVFDHKGENGKKAAVNYGINKAKGDLIITTDVDCTHHRKWLETIVAFYTENKPQMIIAPVIMRGKNYFEKMQSLDFFSLISSSAGAVGINNPIMCNAANMAFEKAIYEKLDDPHKIKYKSGDDIFLMLKIKKDSSNLIKFIKSKEAVCFTNAKTSFRDFVNQRTRWVSKSKGYTDPFLIFTSIIVLLINLSLLFNLLLFLLSNLSIKYFLIQFILKSSIDVIFLYLTSSFYRLKELLKYFISTQVFNIVIVPYLAFIGILSKGKWKNN